MSSLGSIIREARESKQLTIHDLESQTHILSKYIEAIENENFDEIPGEVYVRGFLKNISLKLGLDTEQILTLYKLQISSPQTYGSYEEKEHEEHKKEKPKKIPKKVKIKKEQESTAGIHIHEQMFEISKKEQEMLLPPIHKIRKKRRIRVFPKIAFILLIVLVAAVAAVIFINRNYIKSLLPKMPKIEKNDNRKRNIVENYTKIGVRSGDIIYFKPIGISATIIFESIGNTVKASINDIDISFSKTNPLLVDLNKNGINDFRIHLIDVIEDVAMIEMEKLEENSTERNVQTTTLSEPQNTYSQNENIGSALKIIGNETYILQDVDKASITVECTAKKFVYVRYFIDSENPNTTNLSTGKSITLTANDTIMLTIGNAGEVIVRINGKMVYLGKSGETVNKTIKWVRNVNNTTKFDLIMTDTK